MPRLAGKMDLIPNRINTMWIDPAEPASILDNARSIVGCSTPRCYCVFTPSRLKTSPHGSRQQQKPASDNLSGAAAEGQIVFMHSACINCHTIAGTVATGRFGPDLTHLASRDTIAAGPIRTTPANLRTWIDDPDSMKPGSLMPSMHLNDHDLDVITAYLTTLH